MPAKQILILDTGKEWGGGTNSLIELLKRLVPEGSNRGIDKTKYHFTALFYNNYKKGDESDIKSEIEKLGIDFLVLEHKKQPAIAKILKEVFRALFFFSRRLKKYMVFIIDYQFRIKNNAKKIAHTLKDLKIDLLYMNNQPSSNLEGIIASKITGIPALQHSRIETCLNPFEVKAVNQWLRRMICVSEDVRESFVEQGINASICDVVYNGIDQNTMPMITASEIRKKWGVGEDDILIGTVGSLMRRKRIEDLISAMAELHRRVKGQGPRVKVIIVGEGPEMDNLQREVVEKGLQGDVIFTGFQNDAISYINAMDIFVLPSEKEGLPRVILEAMLMAKPVVACDTTGSSELVVDGQTGFLVPVKKPEIMADAILKLIASADLRKKFGQNGKTMVLERFSIGSYISGVSKIFEEVLA